MQRLDPRPLIAHVVYRFDIGGLENGVVNLINRLPEDRYRHAVVALTEVTDFRRRIVRDDVEFIALAKPPGQGIREWPALHRLFRQLRPSIVHTRNIAALEASLPALMAGVPVRIHGEHGWDSADPDGLELEAPLDTTRVPARGAALDRIVVAHRRLSTQRGWRSGVSPDPDLQRRRHAALPADTRGT